MFFNVISYLLLSSSLLFAGDEAQSLALSPGSFSGCEVSKFPSATVVIKKKTLTLNKTETMNEGLVSFSELPEGEREDIVNYIKTQHDKIINDLTEKIFNKPYAELSLEDRTDQNFLRDYAEKMLIVEDFLVNKYPAYRGIYDQFYEYGRHRSSEPIAFVGNLAKVVVVTSSAVAPDITSYFLSYAILGVLTHAILIDSNPGISERELLTKFNPPLPRPDDIRGNEVFKQAQNGDLSALFQYINKDYEGAEHFSEDSKSGTKPKYENPGHHDTNSQNYNNSKSKLPEGHKEFWGKSILAKDGNRWTKVGEGKDVEFHRFQNNGNGKWHWNGSTKGTTKSGKPRVISPNNVPIEIKRL